MSLSDFWKAFSNKGNSKKGDLAKTWKAPLEVLGRELWSVREGLLIASGWVEVTEQDAGDVFKYNKSWVNIASGKVVKEVDPEVEPYFSQVELDIDSYVRDWNHSDHDYSHRRREAVIETDKILGDDYEVPFSEWWTKAYFVDWALRHRYELPWLEAAIQERYVTEKKVAVEDIKVRPNYNSKPWKVKESHRETDYSPQLIVVLNWFCKNDEPPPSQGDVLAEWKKHAPMGITNVTDKGFDVKTRKGEINPVTAKALGQAIKARIEYL